MGARFTIASGHAKTTEAIEQVLRSGGNVFDAAVAGGFATGFTEPMLSSVGGGGYLVAMENGGTPTAYDFFPNTPGLGKDTSELNPKFFEVEIRFSSTVQPFHVGAGSIAVPSALKGLIEVHADLGRLPLKEVLSPVVEMARTGIPMTQLQSYAMELLLPIFKDSSDGQRLFLKNGTPLQAGELSRNTDYADFLEQLPEDKGRDFYEGELGRKLIQDLQSHDSLLTAEDLKNYQVKKDRAFYRKFGSIEVYCNPMPAIGGLMVLLSLEAFERYRSEIKQWGNLAHIQTLMDIMKKTESLKDQKLASFDGLEQSDADGLFEWVHKSGTTHLSVADSEGNVATLSLSNGEGSGVFAPNCGFMLNNMMGEEDLHPEGFHANTPGKRLASMMAPLIAVENGVPRLAIGSGGSKRIRTAVFQVLLGYLHFNRSLEQSILDPRIHWDGETLQIEPGFNDEIINQLEGPKNVWDELSLYFGGTHTVIPGREAMSDPRRDGSSKSLEI